MKFTRKQIAIGALLFFQILPAVCAEEFKLQKPPVQIQNGLRIVELAGSPYEIGSQHGRALAPSVREMAERALRYFEASRQAPLMRALVGDWQLKQVWRAFEPYVPKEYLEELRGLSDGSGVSVQKLYQLQSLPDGTFTGAGFAAWGQATTGGRLIHLRNLDWDRHAGLQEYATVFVVRPNGGLAYVNLGWAGFVGVVSGINERRIAVGAISAESVDVSLKGEPMVFILRDVLQESGNLDEAINVVERAPRTRGFNYVFSDAYTGKGVAIETTHQFFKVFRGSVAEEEGVEYAKPLKDAVFRAETVIDPTIRDVQLASNGDPHKPGLEMPTGNGYETRYLGQARGIERNFGRLNVEAAQGIARDIAPDSNIQSVVYAWPEVWIADAQGDIPAVRTKYRALNVEQLLK